MATTRHRNLVGSGGRKAFVRNKGLVHKQNVRKPRFHISRKIWWNRGSSKLLDYSLWINKSNLNQEVRKRSSWTIVWMSSLIRVMFRSFSNTDLRGFFFTSGPLPVWCQRKYHHQSLLAVHPDFFFLASCEKMGLRTLITYHYHGNGDSWPRSQRVAIASQLDDVSLMQTAAILIEPVMHFFLSLLL